MCGGRWSGCARRGVDDCNGIVAGVGHVFDVGVAHESLRVLVVAVLFLVLRLLLVVLGVAVQLALVLLVFGDARLRAIG